MRDKPDHELLIVLQDTSRHMRTLAERMVRPTGLTRAQLMIISRVQRQPNLSQKELATLLEVSPMTVARLVDRLEELGLVQRCVDANDRRIWRLRLTAAAVPLLDQIGRFRADLHRNLTKGIDPSLLKAVEDGLRQMKAKAQALLEDDTKK